jgi:hypothetical protein
MMLSVMKNQTARLVSSLCLIFITLTVNAQIEQAEATCPAGITKTADEDSFVVSAIGEILHIDSNLIFMRCSLGQQWDGTTCAGEPTAYNWQQALSISIQTDFNNSKNWRLPNIKELNVIAERACVRPSINDAIFPNTSPDDYWTSTPAMLNDTASWSVAFTNASNTQRLKTGSLFVRLVRTKLPSE